MTSYKMADTETDSAGDNSNLPAFHSSGTGENGIEGDIHIPVPSDDEDELNTLDEPVSETLVCTKEGFVSCTPLSLCDHSRCFLARLSHTLHNTYKHHSIRHQIKNIPGEGVLYYCQL